MPPKNSGGSSKFPGGQKVIHRTTQTAFVRVVPPVFTVDCNDSVELKGIRKELINLKALSVSSATYILLNAKKRNPQDLQRWNMNSKQDPLRPRLDLDFRFMKSPLRFTGVSHTNEPEINVIALSKIRGVETVLKMISTQIASAIETMCVNW